MSPPKDEEDIPLVPPQQTVQTSTQVEALRTAEEEELASKKRAFVFKANKLKRCWQPIKNIVGRNGSKIIHLRGMKTVD